MEDEDEDEDDSGYAMPRRTRPIDAYSPISKATDLMLYFTSCLEVFY